MSTKTLCLGNNINLIWFNVWKILFAFSGLWGLVNNAGVWFFSELEMTSEAVLQKVMNVNLFGPVRLTRALLPLIRQAKGRITNVSSLMGTFPNSYFIVDISLSVNVCYVKFSHIVACDVIPLVFQNFPFIAIVASELWSLVRWALYWAFVMLLWFLQSRYM